MSHAEIWDDSALVDSWNEALEEYKHYHSIHARGENVEEALQSSKTSSELLEAPAETVRGSQNGAKSDDTVMDGPDKRSEFFVKTESHTKLSSADQTADLKRENTSRGGPEIPQHLIGSVHDEGLKNLLMSWYYAGYYTGLYEGKTRST